MERLPSVSLRRDPSGRLPSADPVAMRPWVLAFCVIRFDLEQGQVVEECFPPDALPQNQLLLVAFSSFPDSMSHHHLNPNPNPNPARRTSSSSIHDSIFSFRFPAAAAGEFIYGYVFNRRRQDERLRRGGEQKSVVILSGCPYSSLFRPLLQILGPLCFDIGPSALGLVASHVAAWPPPVPGTLMDLPIGSAALRVHLPPKPNDPAAPFPPTNPTVPHGLFHDADLFGSFRSLLLHLWTLWELMLAGEPILVFAPTPPQCSEAVAALVSLVAPLPFAVDFRPYFTIHDPDFARLNSLGEGEAFPPMVLGVTNLFFLKTLRNIPHVVSVGSTGANATRNLSAGGRFASTGGIGNNFGPGKLNLDQLSLKKFSPSGFLNAMKLRREGPLCLMTEHKEAVWSPHAATTKPDTAVLNRLIDSPRVEESMSVANNEILRRHFLELTTNFLAPFGPYLRATTPLEGASPFMEPPPLPPFDAHEFLNGLATRGPGKFLSKRMRSNWLELYRRFLEGKNFMPWFQKRRAVAEQEQHRLWKQARLNTDINKLISTMSEVETVDSFNAIERHLLAEIQQQGSATENSATTCEKLKGDLRVVFNMLPKDMQQLMLSNPKRAALLKASIEPVKTPKHSAMRWISS
ncbi:protein DENND6B-like [Zingiber officinale]|uniref:protein DENND6B-like n=1 Tax=Zingiber officinale TaxID=94328 RepID=UPI001C4BA548|nr:protein DENND6B-like [Zingiber officinale]